MKTVLKKTLALVFATLLIILPLERPDTNSDNLKSDFMGEPAYNLLSDDFEDDFIIK